MIRSDYASKDAATFKIAIKVLLAPRDYEHTQIYPKVNICAGRARRLESMVPFGLCFEGCSDKWQIKVLLAPRDNEHTQIYPKVNICAGRARRSRSDYARRIQRQNGKSKSSWARETLRTLSNPKVKHECGQSNEKHDPTRTMLRKMQRQIRQSKVNWARETAAIRILIQILLSPGRL